MSLFAFVLSTVIAAGSAFEPMSADKLATLPSPQPLHRIAYGSSEHQFAELFLPESNGPFPTAVLVHGGCWLTQFDLAHVRSLAAALADAGIAVWSVEYRRVGQSEGGWPHTFLDVADAADKLADVADDFQLDKTRTIAIGHSAGGHLALWLAGRHKLPHASDLFRPNPLELKGVLALAPAPMLSDLHEAEVCGNVIDGLMGGSPGEYPTRYAHATPSALLPLGVPQTVLLGLHDSNWAPGGEAYWQAASNTGDRVKKLVAEESGHFEMIVPTTSSWPMVLDAAQQLLGL